MTRVIDVKSFIIGFLLAMVAMLLLGAASSSGDIQDVRIVAISATDPMLVKLKENSLPVELVEVKYGLEVPVVVKRTR